MFRIIKIKRNEVADKLERSEDPLIVDIRGESDNELKTIFGRDYVHLVELKNKGITQIIFRSPILGEVRLLKLLEKAEKFQREFIIIYDKLKHVNKVMEILKNGRKQRNIAI